MNLLLLQAEVIDYTQWGIAGAILMLVIVFLGFLLKALPTWKEIKTREFDVRTEEAKVTGQISTALMQTANANVQLAGAIGTMSEVMENVIVKHEKFGENLIILQRSASHQVDSLAESVAILNDRVDSFEEMTKENGIYVANRPKAVSSK